MTHSDTSTFMDLFYSITVNRVQLDLLTEANLSSISGKTSNILDMNKAMESHYTEVYRAGFPRVSGTRLYLHLAPVFFLTEGHVD